MTEYFSLAAEFALAGDHAWRMGLQKFDLGDRRYISALIAEFLARPDAVTRFCGIPSEKERAGIAAIIAGTRKPDARGHGNKPHYISPSKKASAIEQLRLWREERDAMKATKDRPKEWTNKKITHEFNKACEQYAARLGVDVSTLNDWAKASRGTK